MCRFARGGLSLSCVPGYREVSCSEKQSRGGNFTAPLNTLPRPGLQPQWGTPSYKTPKGRSVNNRKNKTTSMASPSKWLETCCTLLVMIQSMDMAVTLVVIFPTSDNDRSLIWGTWSSSSCRPVVKPMVNKSANRKSLGAILTFFHSRIRSGIASMASLLFSILCAKSPVSKPPLPPNQQQQ